MTRYGESPFCYHIPPKERKLTDRDHQAMDNFADICSLEAIAENYNCSASYVLEVVKTRPWLRPKAQRDNAVNMTWWESNHNDPLELVKTFYPEYLPDDVSPEIEAKEKRDKMTWREYLDSIDIMAVYEEGGKSAVDAIYEIAQEIALLDGINLTFK